MNHVSTRPARLTDLPRLFYWRNHPDQIQLSSSKQTVSFTDHARWFLSSLSRNYNHIYIIRLHTGSLVTPIGQIRFTKALDHAQIYIISIYLISPFSGQGFGQPAYTHALRNFLNYLFRKGNTDSITLNAVVRSENTRSLRFFAKLGFTRMTQPQSNDFTHLSTTLACSPDE